MGNRPTLFDQRCSDSIVIEIAEILASYPSLEVQSIYAAIAYDSEMTRERIVPLPMERLSS